MVLLVLAIIVAVVAVLYWLFMSSFSQLFGRYQWQAKTDEKVIALTFDDGPNEPYTSQILATLEKYHAKATFFEVGNCIRRHPEVTKRILAAGHTIGNHSLSHEFHRYFMPHFLDREIKTNQQILKEVIGKTPALYRSPWLWRTPFLLRALRRNGLTPISGEFCHSREFMRIDPEQTAQGALKKARPGAIIIFHDGKEGVGGNRSETAQAVAMVVEELHKQGYKFVTVDKLLGIPAYQ